MQGGLQLPEEIFCRKGRSLTGAISCTCGFAVGIMLVGVVVTELVGAVCVVIVLVADIVVTITIVTTTHCFLPLVCT